MNLGDKKLNKIKVIAFVGFGRSGTTIIDNVLGQNSKIFSAGEIRHIWDRGLCKNQLCGCGKDLILCDFWSEVLANALGADYQKKVKEFRALALDVDQPKHLIKMFLGRKKSEYSEKKALYLKLLRKLFQSLANTLGDDITILDSSKTPSHVQLLSELDCLDLKTVHVVRDPRAVAYSWSRTKVRPEIQGHREVMPKYSSFKSAVWWFGANLVSEIICNNSRLSYLLRYEDFSESPKKAIGDLLAAIGEDNDVEFLSENSLNLEPNHTVAGNPSRFKVGEIEIKPDASWKIKMRSKLKIVVVLLDWPLMLKYDYK